MGWFLYEHGFHVVGRVFVWFAVGAATLHGLNLHGFKHLFYIRVDTEDTEPATGGI